MLLKQGGKLLILKKANKVSSLLSNNKELSKVTSKEDNPANEFLYFTAIALHADVPNANGDMFPKEELKKSYETFIGKNLFLNHQTDDITKAVGKIIDAWYIESKEDGDYVICLCKISRSLYPTLVKQIELGILDSVSMGCSVQESKCSICGKVVTCDDDACEHLKNFLGQEIAINGKKEKVIAINSKISFNELSIVSDPADVEAKMMNIYANTLSNKTRFEMKKLAEDTKVNLEEVSTNVEEKPIDAVVEKIEGYLDKQDLSVEEKEKQLKEKFEVHKDLDATIKDYEEGLTELSQAIEDKDVNAKKAEESNIKDIIDDLAVDTEIMELQFKDEVKNEEVKEASEGEQPIKEDELLEHKDANTTMNDIKEDFKVLQEAVNKDITDENIPTMIKDLQEDVVILKEQSEKEIIEKENKELKEEVKEETKTKDKVEEKTEVKIETEANKTATVEQNQVPEDKHQDDVKQELEKVEVPETVKEEIDKSVKEDKTETKEEAVEEKPIEEKIEEVKEDIKEVIEETTEPKVEEKLEEVQEKVEEIQEQVKFEVGEVVTLKDHDDVELKIDEVFEDNGEEFISAMYKGQKRVYATKNLVKKEAQVPPKPTTTPATGMKWIFESSSNSWKQVPENTKTVEVQAAKNNYKCILAKNVKKARWLIIDKSTNKIAFKLYLKDLPKEALKLSYAKTILASIKDNGIEKFASKLMTKKALKVNDKFKLLNSDKTQEIGIFVIDQIYINETSNETFIKASQEGVKDSENIFSLNKFTKMIEENQAQPIVENTEGEVVVEEPVKEEVIEAPVTTEVPIEEIKKEVVEEKESYTTTDEVPVMTDTMSSKKPSMNKKADVEVADDPIEELVSLIKAGYDDPKYLENVLNDYYGIIDKVEIEEKINTAKEKANVTANCKKADIDYDYKKLVKNDLNVLNKCINDIQSVYANSKITDIMMHLEDRLRDAKTNKDLQDLFSIVEGKVKKADNEVTETPVIEEEKDPIDKAFEEIKGLVNDENKDSILINFRNLIDLLTNKPAFEVTDIKWEDDNVETLPVNADVTIDNLDYLSSGDSKQVDKYITESLASKYNAKVISFKYSFKHVGLNKKASKELKETIKLRSEVKELRIKTATLNTKLMLLKKADKCKTIAKTAAIKGIIKADEELVKKNVEAGMNPIQAREEAIKCAVDEQISNLLKKSDSEVEIYAKKVNEFVKPKKKSSISSILANYDPDMKDEEVQDKSKGLRWSHDR